jgi:hypothetical protein
MHATMMKLWEQRKTPHARSIQLNLHGGSRVQVFWTFNAAFINMWITASMLAKAKPNGVLAKDCKDQFSFREALARALIEEGLRLGETPPKTSTCPTSNCATCEQRHTLDWMSVCRPCQICSPGRHSAVPDSKYSNHHCPKCQKYMCEPCQSKCVNGWFHTRELGRAASDLERRVAELEAHITELQQQLQDANQRQVDEQNSET